MGKRLRSPMGPDGSAIRRGPVNGNTRPQAVCYDIPDGWNASEEPAGFGIQLPVIQIQNVLFQSGKQIVQTTVSPLFTGHCFVPLSGNTLASVRRIRRWVLA